MAAFDFLLLLSLVLLVEVMIEDRADGSLIYNIPYL